MLAWSFSNIAVGKLILIRLFIHNDYTQYFHFRQLMFLVYFQVGSIGIAEPKKREHWIYDLGCRMSDLLFYFEPKPI